MKKYIVISCSLLLVMNNATTGMNKVAKFYDNQKYFINPIKRSMTISNYYAACNKSDDHVSTFIISELAIKIKKLEHEKKELENKGFNGQDPTTKDRWHEVERYKKLIDVNKALLRKQLDDLWKQKKTPNE